MTVEHVPAVGTLDILVIEERREGIILIPALLMAMPAPVPFVKIGNK